MREAGVVRDPVPYRTHSVVAIEAVTMQGINTKLTCIGSPSAMSIGTTSHQPTNRNNIAAARTTVGTTTYVPTCRAGTARAERSPDSRQTATTPASATAARSAIASAAACGPVLFFHAGIAAPREYQTCSIDPRRPAATGHGPSASANANAVAQSPNAAAAYLSRRPAEPVDHPSAAKPITPRKAKVNASFTLKNTLAAGTTST